VGEIVSTNITTSTEKEILQSLVMKRILEQITDFVHQQIASTSSPEKESNPPVNEKMSKKESNSGKGPRKLSGRRTDLDLPSSEAFKVPSLLEGVEENEITGPISPYGKENPPTPNSEGSIGEAVDTDDDTAPKTKAQALKRLQKSSMNVDGASAVTVQRQMTLDGKPLLFEELTNKKNGSAGGGTKTNGGRGKQKLAAGATTVNLKAGGTRGRPPKNTGVDTKTKEKDTAVGNMDSNEEPGAKKKKSGDGSEVCL
jgi:hypothetical protein